MPDRNNLRSQALDLLRFPLAVVIVIIHVFAHALESAGQPNHPLITAVCAFIQAFLKSQSVPIYFFISGYVFFLGIELTKQKYVQKLKNRVKSLLIPYLIWNALAVVVLVIKCSPLLQSEVGG